jgi:hypothetical protein
MMDDTEWSWTSNVAQTIATTLDTIKVDVPCGQGVLTVRIGRDSKDCFHTHMTLSHSIFVQKFLGCPEDVWAGL